MQTRLLLLLLACLPALACGPGKSVASASDSSSDDSSSGDPTTSDTNDPATGDGDGDPDDETDDDSSLTFVPDDDVVLCGVCDTWAQDCSEGEKCVPGPDRGGSCGPPSCKTILDDKQPGEPCSVDGDGYDDCGENSWCYPAMLDVEGPAFCVEFCSGTVDNSSCTNPDEVCVFDHAIYWGDLGCRPRCNPLQPEGCAAGETCTIGTSDQRDFGCVISSAEQATGEACSLNQDCAAGLCIDALELPDCADEACCASVCDVLAPECPAGTQCVPIELADNPEPTIGVCTLAP